MTSVMDRFDAEFIVDYLLNLKVYPSSNPS